MCYRRHFVREVMFDVLMTRLRRSRSPFPPSLPLCLSTCSVVLLKGSDTLKSYLGEAEGKEAGKKTTKSDGGGKEDGWYEDVENVAV